MMNQKIRRTAKLWKVINRKEAVLVLLLMVVVFIFSGCWTPPNANVQPAGPPRLIQNDVAANANDVPATVQSVDAVQRALLLQVANGVSVACSVNPQVKDFDKIHSGDKIEITLAEKLAVYVLKDGGLPMMNTNETIPFIAKVQLVDPSYRLLTVQFPNGQTEVLKAGLDAKLLEMQPGDAVVLESAEAKAIRIKK